MSVERLVLGVLATWTLSALLYYWSGFEWLRVRAGIDMVDEFDQPITFWGRQLHCFWCVVLWVSVPVAAVVYFAPLVLTPLAFAGGAMLLSKGGRVIWREMADG